jgi:hypothetical protein
LASPCPYSSQDRLDAFWRTLIADAFMGQRQPPKELFRQFEVWSGRKDLASVIDLEEIPERLAYPPPYMRALEDAATGCRLIISDKWYVGLAPESAEEGDLICILLGGQTPFVLRQAGDHYTLIGPCYVHGIMDGEAMEQVNVGKFQLRDFALV